jgi:hypothetical protein
MQSRGRLIGVEEYTTGLFQCTLSTHYDGPMTVCDSRLQPRFFLISISSCLALAIFGEGRSLSTKMGGSKQKKYPQPIDK